MKTYNFKMTRVYETNLQFDAKDEQDAHKRLEDLKDDIYAEEIRQCNVIEEKIELEQILTKIEKAVYWFQSRNIEVSDSHTSLGIVLPIIGLDIEVSDYEIDYRASLWDNERKG